MATVEAGSMRNTLSLKAGFTKNHSVTGGGFYVGLNNHWHVCSCATKVHEY